MDKAEFNHHGAIVVDGIEIGSGGFSCVVARAGGDKWTGTLTVTASELPSAYHAMTMLHVIGDAASKKLHEMNMQALAEAESEGEAHEGGTP